MAASACASDGRAMLRTMMLTSGAPASIVTPRGQFSS
jgi:hypothetical protein